MSMDQESLSTEEQTERAEARELMVPMTPAELGLITTALTLEINRIRRDIAASEKFPSSQILAEAAARAAAKLPHVEEMKARLLKIGARLSHLEWQAYCGEL